LCGKRIIGLLFSGIGCGKICVKRIKGIAVSGGRVAAFLFLRERKRGLAGVAVFGCLLEKKGVGKKKA